MKKIHIIIILFFCVDSLFSQTFLEADTSKEAYSILGEKGFGYEVPDCGHTVPHINTKWDAILKKCVFDFGMHLSLDDDRCINKDRQRIEILKNGANYGQTIFQRWKFFLDSGFKSSPNFCHIHQIKAANGTDADSPIMTISTRYGANNTDKLQIIFTAPITKTTYTLYQTLLAPFKGTWVEALETVTYGDTGKYNLVIKRVSDDKTLMSYTNDTLALWRWGGDSANYTRPKYGLYRSLTSPTYLRDENVLFADFAYQKIALPNLPFAPIDFKITSVVGNRVTLAWKDTSTREDQFRIDRSADSVTWLFVSTSKANSTSVTDSIPGQGIYYYRIRSENSSGNSSFATSSRVAITSVAKDENSKPMHYFLDQNFPNPFNPNTTINYYIPKDGYTKLSVYDIVGNKVASLVEGNKFAGSYRVQFNGRAFSSGIYFYTLESGGHSITHKMLMLK